MTLFRKVFSDQNIGTPVEPEDVSEDEADMTQEVNDDLFARLASIRESKSAGTPKTPEFSVRDDDEPPETVEPPLDQPEQAEDFAFDALESPMDETAAEMTMAERAAEAHKQMQNSHMPGRVILPPDAVPEESQQEMKSEMTAEQEVAPPVDVSAPQSAPVTERRARTRLLGFNESDEVENDPFARDAMAAIAPSRKFPVGWFVVIDGPGQGSFFAVYDGVSTIGRGDDQTVRLDFGDSCISRQNHATFAYDNEQNDYFLGHGGKSNIIRLNDRPVLSTEKLAHADVIRIGETTLKFIALCGDDFSWGAR